MRDDASSLRQKILDVSEAQAEPVIEPHGVANDLRRKPMPVVATRLVDHHRNLPDEWST